MRVRLAARPSNGDIAIAAAGLALTEVASWVPGNPIGNKIAGPAIFIAVYAPWFALPLAWRRIAPLATLSITLSALLVQSVSTNNSPEGLENLVVGVAVYSVAAYAARTRALIGLGLSIAAYTVYAVCNRDVQTGLHSQLWAASFFGAALVAAWLLGFYVRYRRDEHRMTARAEAAEQAAETAVAEERARLARELHDVVSHNLSVVVLQAAGARAAGAADTDALEKIERSGRDSLVEMRRLLGVLRSDGDGPSLAPQPGIGELGPLTQQLVDAGVAVDLTVEGADQPLPAALDLSVYRIVQEALTNVVKHAGPARATVRIRCTATAVTIDVEDDGCGTAAPVGDRKGHGLIGMRERVALFNGELSTGARRGGGFAVHARLLREGGPA